MTLYFFHTLCDKDFNTRIFVFVTLKSSIKATRLHLNLVVTFALFNLTAKFKSLPQLAIERDLSELYTYVVANDFWLIFDVPYIIANRNPVHASAAFNLFKMPIQ